MSSSKTALVTGAYGEIGKAICRQLAEKDYNVIMIGKDESALKSAAEAIEKQTKNANIRYIKVDLSRKSTIREFAEQWQDKIDLLINNAATTPKHPIDSLEGVETQWATNVLGYYRMMKYLSPYMESSDDPRIVNVASYWAGGLDLDDPEFRNRYYDNDTAYRQSKQADRMLSAAFAQKLKEKGITVNAVHPGDVNSKLSNSLGYGGHESPDQGADTPVWVATAPELKGVSGKYFEHRQETTDQFSLEEERVQRLVNLCESYE
ncbi:MAG: SDR family NAD(P)-dependent oxidoreductase [Bacteroidales bacterium]|nr:SDR family NAD(P)-dependent oxidoreductase [Bacteroidales bacterium]MCF8398077.1 SDR family NAD(P)-dependent oxidoreductase [Bacteroidales bacterium]